jgi:hypothetical protein
MLNISTESLLACAVGELYLSKRVNGLKNKDLEKFVEILKGEILIFSPELKKDMIRIEYPNGRIVYRDDSWRNFYFYKQKKYCLIDCNLKKVKEVVAEQRRILQNQIPQEIIDKTIQKFVAEYK